MYTFSLIYEVISLSLVVKAGQLSKRKRVHFYSLSILLIKAILPSLGNGYTVVTKNMLENQANKQCWKHEACLIGYNICSKEVSKYMKKTCKAVTKEKKRLLHITPESKNWGIKRDKLRFNQTGNK